MNMSADDCGSIQYSAALSSGKSLPAFIKFEPKALAFKIESSTPADSKDYSIVVRGVPDIYDIENSDISRNFILTVNCTAKKLYIKKSIPK